MSIPGTDWVAVSGYEGGGARPADISHRDAAGQTRRSSVLGPPGPPDPAEKDQFSAPGLNVPRSMSVRIVVEYPSTDVFFGATAALQIQREIWIGSVRRDRIARYPVD